MEVILRENVEGLGKRGDVVRVKDGYARNYLIPRKLAVPVTEGNIKQIELEKKNWALKHQKEIEAAEAVKDIIEKITITVTKKAGENNQLFGSVTAQDIADALAKEKVEIDKKKIELPEQIKELGTFPVKIKIHPEVVVETKVYVVSE
ncbi:large subunit ribosomal protein L9 [Thermotomaculum hydrothermale]|uniref:Large ribosomal subunit protein bL9 n=1 Tax=Thermotomaculum hydrothermale TaxID=981385 RepID=A0A7R6SYY8_9BACT|nr:50S ribosomal protein L9 [Thermotomaculum hydrothermale]BBB33175.1 large subunit ribosomal protein L9 [Thermotomaculum hydrothermale]